jgi:hypothetical protein
MSLVGNSSFSKPRNGKFAHKKVSMNCKGTTRMWLLSWLSVGVCGIATAGGSVVQEEDEFAGLSAANSVPPGK